MLGLLLFGKASIPGIWLCAFAGAACTAGVSLSGFATLVTVVTAEALAAVVLETVSATVLGAAAIAAELTVEPLTATLASCCFCLLFDDS